MSDVLAAGVDVGTSAAKLCVVRVDQSGHVDLLSKETERFRRRDPKAVVAHAFASVLSAAGVREADIAYVASTGEGHLVDFRRGHFYGMTTHARGGVFLCEGATGVLDIGALHARAIRVDHTSKVLGYRMTSQCASGSGQFIENIARYLGVALEEVGPLSLSALTPERPSGICAVLAETDVINMVSRGIARPDILKGIHLAMADRLAKLLRAAKITGKVALTGGLATDIGLRAALAEQFAGDKRAGIELAVHPDAIYAGAIGAAIWGALRHVRLLEKKARAASVA